MRSFVEANQEIGRLHARSLIAPAPEAEPGTGPDVEWDLALIERAIDGIELPDYTGGPTETHTAPLSNSSAKP